ncbi:MAG: hypothetical protein GQ574_09430 [Crocinitomix sp.]|nr:hypothetical protein [Crocinitomix sp.]
MSGKLEKLSILSFETAKFEKVKHTYVALINPEQLAVETSIKFEDSATSGATSTQKNFKGTSSPKLNIKFLFDSTGIIKQDNHEISFSLGGGFDTSGTSSGSKLSGKSNGGSVEEQIEAFKLVTLKCDKGTHEPNYVKLVYGEWLFVGRLSNFKVTYTLFDKDGTALRATGDAAFSESVEKTFEVKNRKFESPDLTHVRTVQEGDTLHLMCQTIYKNPKLYLEIARVNKLSNYRKLTTGEKLFFPPIKELT